MRGRVAFSTEGGDYALRFTTNRLCDLEETSGRSVLEFAEALGTPGGVTFTDIRLLMRVGLEAEMNDEGVGNLIDEVGFKTAIELIAKAFASAFSVDEAKPSGKAKAAAA